MDVLSKTISGTSMTTRHVEGVVGLLLQQNSNLSQIHIKSELIALSDKYRVKDIKTVSNYLSRVPYLEYPTPYPTESYDKEPSVLKLLLWFVLLSIMFIILITVIIYYYCCRSNVNGAVTVNNVETEL